MMYYNRQIYKPRVYGAYILVTGVPPYTIGIASGTYYACALSHGTYYSLDIESGTLYTLEIE